MFPSTHRGHLKAANVIAFDIGAGSGRVSVGSFDGQTLVVSEIYRFANEPVQVLNSLQWDILRVFQELKSSLARLDKAIAYLSVGIDGWGADYGLIDRAGRLLGNVYHYRDCRTRNTIEQLLEKIPPRELFTSTASDLKRHYTLSQLYSQVISGDQVLQVADKFLLIPDLLNYMFTGTVAAEVTIAGTSQLLNPFDNNWNKNLLSRLEIPETLFPPIVPPGTRLEPLLPAYRAETGLSNVSFVSVSGHDTASALTSIFGLDHRSAFVSAGTTIVVGAETEAPLIDNVTFEYGFKNCRGTEGENLLIRNNTGFWILQQCRRLWERQSPISFASLSREARDAHRPLSIFDPESQEFENPESMTESLHAFAVETNQTPPMTRADCTRSIYASLALQVKWCLERLERILQRRFENLYLIGGGANDSFFCELVADCTGLPLHAGPSEATILGNVMIQLAAAQVSSLSDLREVVRRIDGEPRIST